MDLLEDVRTRLEVVAEFTHLANVESADELAAVRHILLPARHPHFAVDFLLFREALKTSHVAQKSHAEAQRRHARKFDPHHRAFLGADPHFPLQISSDSVDEVWSQLMGMVTCFVFYELVIWKFRKLDLAEWAVDSVQFSVVLFLWCSLYFSIKQWQQLTQERERLLRAETEAREARLNALRYQLNPHFLFNSLNAVSTLVLDGNAPAATTMLAQIGELLRTSLDNETKIEVALSQEIAFTQRYLAIEQTRLGERLRVHLAISSVTLDALVPGMLLQPLVENAVRHGVAQFIDGGAITIESEVIVDRLRIVIRNSGRRGSRKLNASGNGIGLSNTEERLKTLYGSNHKFSLGWPETGGCEVTVELPFRKAAQPQEALLCAH